LLKINSDAFSFTLFDGLCHYTTLPKSSRANQDKMICTMNELADIFHFVYSVCEVICIHDCTVFKGILHITTFFVTTFFVVGAKVRIFFETKKKMARNFDIFQSWGAKMTFAPSYSFTLEGADEEDGSGLHPAGILTVGFGLTFSKPFGTTFSSTLRQTFVQSRRHDAVGNHTSS